MVTYPRTPAIAAAWWPRAPVCATVGGVTTDVEHARVSRLVERGMSVGTSFDFAFDGRTFYASVAIGKRDGVYRVRVDAIEYTRMAAEEFARDEVRVFATIDQAFGFILATTPVRLAQLAPSRGSKWF